MQNTRQLILEYIKNHHNASAEELSRALHMTRANARHHLNILAEQGKIEVSGSRPPKGRGRPTQLFGLTQQVMDDNIEQLVDALLKVILADGDPQDQFAALIPHLVPEVDANTNLIQRLNQLVRRLDEMNYQARWEATAEGPRLIFGHCPYAAILEENPELCQMDAVMAAVQLDQDVDQVAKLAPGPRGKPQCVFAVRAP